jgi:hypothetical protein
MMHDECMMAQEDTTKPQEHMVYLQPETNDHAPARKYRALFATARIKSALDQQIRGKGKCFLEVHKPTASPAVDMLHSKPARTPSASREVVL